jgi:DNA modification methylase
VDFVDKILQGDALSILMTLPSESIDCCVTSPPYWGLRDYGVEGQLGLEPDFREFITKLADIFDEVNRVLKPAGTCWVNLGDTYAGSWGNYAPGGIKGEQRPKETERLDRKAYSDTSFRPPSAGARLPVRNKSLCQIPSRFAIEMTDRGWILRNHIIWHKPNCMPSSTKDRFTVDYEDLFFFTKSPKYYFEQQLEPLTTSSAARLSQDIAQQTGTSRANGGRKTNGPLKAVGSVEDGKNKRAVWRISPRPFKEAHFAVFPEELIETPIKAGCPPFGIVLDPFMGSGTTALVARKLVRHFVGIELNPEYIQMAQRRIGQLVLQVA